jgi:hypothetical protein
MKELFDGKLEQEIIFINHNPRQNWVSTSQFFNYPNEIRKLKLTNSEVKTVHLLR